MAPKYLTVTALNRYLKAKFDNDLALRQLYIQAELSNVKYHSSGHCYFTLKDDYSRVNAVMFASQLKKINFRLEDGMKVFALGKASIYEPSGSYQIYVSDIQMDGLGNLYLQYEQIKQKLQKEGLFDAQRKRQLPLYPMNIGVITSSTGAAIHDIEQTIRIHNQIAKIYFFPALVQGAEASQDLIKSLIRSYHFPLDVLIIGRGGGSLEDLWAFNDEQLAYTIAKAPFPIISGVGHESDITICDFVADARGATPTAAARMACFDQRQFELDLHLYQQRLIKAFQRKLETNKKELSMMIQGSPLKHPQYYYANEMMALDLMTTRFHKAFDVFFQNQQHHLENKKSYLTQQFNYLMTYESSRLIKREQLALLMEAKVKQCKQSLEYAVTSLNAYNPLQVLERGFTLVKQEDRMIKSIHDLDKNQPFELQFKDGYIEVEAVKKNER